MTPNDGTRPSRLLLDRFLTGELDDPSLVTDRLDAAARAHLARVQATKSDVRPLDVAALRRRAAQIPHVAAPVEPLPAPANRTRAWKLWMAPILLLAAASLLVALPLTRPAPVDPTYIGVRGGARLEVFQADGALLRPWSGEAVGAGDVLGFKVFGSAQGAVLLGVDGTGVLSVYWPEHGDDPEPLPADGALPGTLVLDDAPGPEIFVVVLDTPVGQARADAQAALQEGGPDGLLAWARSHPLADAVLLERRAP